MAPLDLAAHADSQPRRLRVGLFVDTWRQPRWVLDAFARIAGSAYAEIAVIGCVGTAARPAPLVWRLYGTFDRAAFGSGPDPAEPLDLHTLPHGKSVSGTDFSSLGALDVAFALGEFDDRILDGLARYGVWRFRFGEDRSESEALAGIREVAEGAPISGATLTVRLAPGAAPRVAYQSWSRTFPFSFQKNRANLLRRSAEFPARALRELYEEGPGWLEACRPADEAGAAQDENRGLGPILKLGAKMARRGVEKALNVEQWFLAFKFGERSVTGDLHGFRRLMPPKDRYWADPFVLAKDGRWYVFFEELPFSTGKAWISVLEITRDGQVSAPRKVLERDYHLSYPFLVQHGGELYMIPESAQAGAVEAWRCVEFPLRWRLERTLLSGVSCVDATFHRMADRWWMFANMGSRHSSVYDDELHLFHADDLLGEWTPHAKNPVKSDARSSRPAGELFARGGQLLRPAQICAPLYGSGLSIQRVVKLTPQEYAERTVERILPAHEQGLLGIHTLSHAGGLTVVDAFTRVRRF